MSETIVEETKREAPQKPDPSLPIPHDPSKRMDGRKIAATICLLGIVGCFAAPWISILGESVSGAGFFHVTKSAILLWIIPLSGILTLVIMRRGEVLYRRLATITAVLSWLGVGFVMIKLKILGVIGLSWGASLTVLFGLCLFAIVDERHVIAPADLVARKLSSRKAEVFSHWGTMIPCFHFSAKDFYEKVEQAIRTKQWPSVQLIHIPYSEAGLLSHKREYLRILRQRQLFDICAATFGTDYFFTVREAEIPAVVTVRVFLAVMFGLLVLAVACLQMLGIIFGPLALIFLLVFGVWFLFNVLKLGLTRVDTALMQLPVIGVAYEAWFRKDTYFQQDTRLAFLNSVNELVKQQVEEITSAKGLRFINCFEKQPIMDGLYKRSRVNLKQDEPAESQA